MSTQRIDNDIIVEAFKDATKHVLGSMTQSMPEPGDAFEKTNFEAFGDISTMVTVSDSERRIASISFTMSQEAAVAMAEDTLGELEDPVLDVQEMVGEMMNILSGDARRRLSEQGLTLSGSTPSMILGANHEIVHPCAGKTFAIPFTLPMGFCVVEFNFENLFSD